MSRKLTWTAAGIAAIAAFSSFNTAAAQEAAPRAEPALQLATPPMWRVADADSEFILLGTFHILPPYLDWRTDSLEQALASADTIYFEVDSDAPDTQSKALSVMMLEGFNAKGALLSDMLNEDDAQKLRKITSSLGLPIAGINPMRPWNAFLTLSVQFVVKQGFVPGAGLDSVLLAETRTLGKELVFFESIEEQLALFTELPPETEMSLLVLTLRDWESQTEAFAPLYDAWRTGDVGAIEVMMNEAMRNEAPEVYARLLADRNKAWVETLAMALGEGSGAALVAVGAGHLTGGADSVPALLAAKGYEVSRYGDWAGAAANDNPPAYPMSIDDILETEIEPTPNP